jgi:hypothetical protein
VEIDKEIESDRYFLSVSIMREEIVIMKKYFDKKEHGMKEKGKLVKKFGVFCFLFLVIGFISAVCLQAQNQEKETKKKSEIKSEQTKNNNEIQQSEKEDIEDIKPPNGEQWYEPGDEEIYTLKLNIQKPKEGIAGGKLIYYGVYIEPPYKVEVKDHSIFVNGINISTSPEGLLDRIHQRDQAMKVDYIPKLSPEEKKEYEYSDNLSKILRSKQREIFNKHDSDYEANTEAMDNEFKEYLHSDPVIVIVDYCDFRNVFVRYRLPSGELSGVYLISCYCRSAKQKEAQALMWEKIFKKDYKSLIEALNSSIYICDIGGSGYGLESKISGICNILQQKIPRDQKIAKIYLLLNESIIDNAKLYYYNFDTVKFGCVELSNEKK